MIVLHVLDHSLPVVSGYSTRSRSIVTFQRELGLRPVVLTSPKHTAPGNSREMLDGIVYHRAMMPRATADRVPYLAELRLMAHMNRRIAQVARAEGAQLLHAHSPVLNGLPALVAGRRLRLPVVYEARAFWEDAAVDHGTTHARSLRYRVSRAMETLLFKHVDRVVTIGEALRREIVERGVAAERVAVVPNGVDTDWFHPMDPCPELRARLGLGEAPVIGFIGSFYAYEGLRFLVEAWPKLRARVPGARLVLVGGGEEAETLRASVQPGDGVIFAGQVPHSEVRQFYSLIDVFVCPRRRMRLTELVTPLKPLEAMAMGRPVLASDVGGLAELIRHDETGLLFPAESQEAFVTQAARLAGSAELRARLGGQARQAVAAERGWRHIAARYLDLYPEVA